MFSRPGDVAGHAAARGGRLIAAVVLAGAVSGNPAFAAPPAPGGARTSSAGVPTDPLFMTQWALHNTGQTGGTPGADVDAVRAWDLVTGDSGVVLAVLDTGLDLAHPDLAANLYTNSGEVAGNSIDDDGNGFVDDVHGWNFVAGNNDVQDDQGHGTLMSGAAARGNDGVGIAGLCWTVRILPVKCLNSAGTGTMADLVEGILYATRMGADVILAGWGGGPYSQAMADAIAMAGAAAIPFVAVAGGAARNLDTNPVYPASYALPNVVAVAATGANDALASFSGWGPATVDLAAPGVNVPTTLLGGTWGSVSGTGVAASLTAAALCLLASRSPSLHGDAAIARLLSNVDVVPGLAGVVASGGRLNAYLPLVVTPSTAEGLPPAGGGPQPRIWWSAGPPGTTRLGFSVPHGGRTQLDVFDVRGRCRGRLVDTVLLPGSHAVAWDQRDERGRGVASGVYVVRLRSGGASRTAQVVLRR